MWTTLHAARLKIKRANEHIADVQRIISGLPDAYIATIEIDPESGREVIKHALPNNGIPIREDLALIIGDAIHNLKSALDLAWCEIRARLNPEASKTCKFPVVPTGDKLKSDLDGIKIDITCRPLYDLMISEIKPYPGGNDTLWTIHQLDIDDKHRILLPLVNYAAIYDIQLEDETGKIHPISTYGTTQDAPLFIPIPGHFKIKEKGKVAVEVIFEQGSPAEYFGVSDALHTYSVLTLNIIQLLENV